MEPPILYKYRHFDSEGRSLRLIQFSEIWFARADSFNDPFDTAFTYNFDGLNDELAEKWARESASRQFTHLPPAKREQAALQRLQQIRADKSYQEEVRRIHIEQNYAKFGICSLAASRDNLLMWAHYAGQHAGFVVGLSYPGLQAIQQKLVASRQVLDLLKVEYSDHAPDANFFKSMLDLEETDTITKFYTTKSLHWRYEEEYRLVLWDGVNSTMQIGHELIEEVILGCRISETNRESILHLRDKFAPHSKVWQAHKDRKTFSLVLEQIR